MRRMKADAYKNIILHSHNETDIELQDAVLKLFLEKKQAEYVFMAAAKVKCLLTNDTYPKDFIRLNLMVQNYIINASPYSGVRKFRRNPASAQFSATYISI